MEMERARDLASGDALRNLAARRAEMGNGAVSSTPMRTERSAVVAVLWTVFVTSCNRDLPPAELDGGRSSDAGGEPTFDADVTSADVKIERGQVPDPDPIPDAQPDAADRDASFACQICDPPGGQYCGTIGERCTRRNLNCGLDCKKPGLTCGGGGRANVCGAARDSGVCEVTVCLVLGATYCGLIGDGCGGTIDCGACSGPTLCGAGGIPGVCGIPEDRCTRATCTTPAARYCGVIGDGCGGILDCGACSGADVCGITIPHMCGLDPLGIALPQPAPVPPPPPGPPPPYPPSVD